MTACEPVSDSTEPVEPILEKQNTLNMTLPPMKQPIAEKRPHEMTLHGDTRVDEYFWLRDDTRKDPQVLAYLEQENAYFAKKWSL